MISGAQHANLPNNLAINEKNSCSGSIGLANIIDLFVMLHGVILCALELESMVSPESGVAFGRIWPGLDDLRVASAKLGPMSTKLGPPQGGGSMMTLER